MTIAAHHASLHLGGIVLKLRDDLSVSVREQAGQPLYVIEDELNSRFYRVGAAEYTFLSMLDGRTTFADALGRTASVMRQEALNESEAASLCRWLVESHLASTAESRSSGRLLEAAQRARRRRLRQVANPMFIKAPLLNPDQLLRVASGLFGWLQSWPMFMVWLAVVISGTACVAMHWSEATAMTSSIVSPDNWIWLGATWLLLKLVHEFSHGIACRRRGVPVREAGVLMILFVPLPYVDVTSAWRLDSRWQRISISAAGMYAELFFAAVAALVWSSSEPGLLRQHAFNVMFMASVVTVLFNANPLMRFDGYYMLTDLLDLPNLAAHGQSFLMSLGRRWALGLPGHAPRWPAGRTPLVLLYGIAALLWRVVVCAGLILAADALYYGAGAVLAVLAVVLWVVVPLAKLVKFVVVGSETEQPRRRRFAMVVAVMVVLCAAAAQTPCCFRVEAPAVVDYDPVSHVRAAVAGFVKEVRVRGAQTVARDDVLVVLSSPELAAERSQLASQLEQSRQRGRIFFQRMEVAAWQAESEAAASLASRLRQLDDRIAELTIRAPHNGQVLDSDMQSLLGAYVSIGQRVTSLGARGQKKLLAMVSERNIQAFEERAGAGVDVHIWGSAALRYDGRLLPAEPRASTRIPHPAFAAVWGGPLDVRMAPAAGDGEARFEFVEPQFLTRVGLQPALLSRLAPGRLGFVSFRSHQGRLGSIVGQAVHRWWHDRQAALRARWFR